MIYDGRNLDGIYSVALSADNISLYASTFDIDNVVLFRREPDTGVLMTNIVSFFYST